MSRSVKSISVESFVKHRLKDREAMLGASRHIDEFRKKYGKADKTFNSTKIIRRMRDTRQ